MSEQMVSTSAPANSTGGHWSVGLVFGVLWVVLGALAISTPVLFTLSAVWFFGWILFIGGLLQIVFALADWKSNGSVSFLGGVISLVFGLLLINNVFIGAVTFTSLIGMFFFIQGVLSTVQAFEKKEGRGLLLALGLISFFFAFIILGNIIVISPALIGLLIGWNFIISGFGLIAANTFADNNAEQGQKVLGAIIFFFVLYFFLAQIFAAAN